MGTSLTGKNISASYLGLLKSTDNSAISTSAKTITDGAGNDLPIKLSTAQFLVSNGSVSAPTIGFSNETNTGFYHTTGEINATIAGTNKITIDGSQTHIKGSTLLIDSSDDSGELRFNYSSATDSRSWEMRNDVLSDGDFWLGVSDTRTGTSYSTVMNINRSGNIALGGSSASSVYNIYLGDKTFVRGNNTTALTINRSASYGDILELQSQGGVFAQFSGLLSGTTRIFEIEGYSTDSEIRLSTSGSNRFIIDTNGNIRFNSYGGGTITGTATQRLGVDSSGNVIEIPIGAGAVDGAGATGQASFWVDSDTISGDDDFYWDNTNKRLGIGTNNPNQLLELSKNGSPVIRLNSSKTTTGAVGDSIGRIEFRGSSTAGNGAGIKAVIDTSATTTTQRDFDLLFKTGNNVGSGEPTTSMVIGADGNVGISTDSPNRNLTIKNSSDGANGLSFQSYATTSEVGYIRYEQTNDIIDIFNTSSYSGSGIKFSTNSADAMFLDVDGNLGIATTSPEEQFTVGGTGTQGRIGLNTTGVDHPYIQMTQFGSPNTNVTVRIDAGGDSYFNGGNVGIGTVSPTNYYSGADNLVVSQATGEGGISIVTATDTTGALYFADGTSGDEQYRGGIAYSHSSEKLSLVSGGSTKMIIDSSGNVGIGESNPETKLHVEGTIQLGNEEDLAWAYDNGSYYNYITNFYNSTDGLVYRSGSWTGNQTYVAHSFETWTGSAWDKKLAILQNGSVGIGTNSPSGKLNVEASGNHLHLRANTATAGKYWNFDITSANQLYIVNNGGTGMTIKDTGEVGIGTTSPSQRLDVSGYARATNGFVGSSGLSLFGDNSSTERVFVTTDGLVGIGTGTSVVSDTKLEVRHDGSDLTHLRLRNNGNGDHVRIRFQGNNTSGSARYADIRFDPDDQLLYFTNPYNSTARMGIDSDGVVTIGATNQDPIADRVSGFSAGDNGNGRVKLMQTSTDALLVGRGGAGNVQRFFYNATGTASQVGSISITSSSTAYNTSSDYRLKENVVELTGALDRISQLKPSRFNFIADAETTVDGFLAHEVQDIVPEAITGEKDETEEYEVTPEVLDDDGNVVEEAVMGTRDVYQGIDQSKLVPLLVASIQELKAEIDELKKKL